MLDVLRLIRARAKIHKKFTKNHLTFASKYDIIYMFPRRTRKEELKMVVYGTVTTQIKFILDEETENVIKTFAAEHRMDICTAVAHLYDECVINLFNGNEQPDANWSVEVTEVEMGEMK